MKRLLLVVACVLVLTGPAGADEFNALDLYVTGFYETWSTRSATYPLGVSSTHGGPLMNDPDWSIPLLSDGVYYLYVGDYGSYPESWSENKIVSLTFRKPNPLNPDFPYAFAANFAIKGSPGAFHLWTLSWTDDWSWPGPPPDLPTIYLGWAQGSANLMGGTPDDAYMVMGFNQEPPPIPLPGAVWLLGTGLVGLIGLRRKLRA